MPTGIAVELPQDSTELDLFKLLFGDDIVDYIIAKTKLYVEQKRSESEKETLRVMQEEKTAGGAAKVGKGLKFVSQVEMKFFFEVVTRIVTTQFVVTEIITTLSSPLNVRHASP